MKKIIMTLAIAVSSFSAFAGEVEVTSKVREAFTSEFGNAGDVTWTLNHDYYKAAFTYNNRYVFAFYSMDGELLALTRYISSADLPISLLKTIKSNYSDYWISDLFEMSKHDGTSYFITLEDAETKMVLKSTGGSWTVHQKTRKA